MEEILKIPGNPHTFKLLRQCLKSGEAIAFVGAGASAGLYPLWNDLITHLVCESLKRGLADQSTKDYWIKTAQSHPSQTVKRIKRALGAQIYASILQGIFAPRTGSDGNRFTPIHSALLRSNYRGFVTTNYDPGLLEARYAEREAISTTGYTTHQDRDDVYGWLTEDIFKTQRCPILFAHGIYQRSETIVLGVEEYRTAYRPGLYRRLFEKLWSQNRLVVVGYSFSDHWLNFLSEEIITGTISKTSGSPRHIALVGMAEGQSYTPEMRRFFQDNFNAETIFYPIHSTKEGKEDHSSLLLLLEEVAGEGREHEENESATPKGSAGKHKLNHCWIHETTNDNRYSGRSFSLLRLDRWVADHSVRVIAVTGMGGQGKTALIGHWLKEHGGDRIRPMSGLFFWSFYANRSVRAFIDRFLDFAGWRDPNEMRNKKRRRKKSQRINEVPRTKAVINMLTSRPFLIVLDGLEVLQERPGTNAYGRLLEDELRDILDSTCRIRHNSLLVLTSRFPFADLTPYLGSSLRGLELDRLSPIEGELLLSRSNVRGSRTDRESVCHLLEGHPLALKIFAAALATQKHGDPTRLWNMVFDQEGLEEDDPLEGKLRRLLRFYDDNLPDEQRLVLSVVSLFRAPIEEPIVITLSRRKVSKHACRKEAVTKASREAGDSRVRTAINGLIRDGLLLREHEGSGPQYACHPVLRDHFRTSLISDDTRVASEAAGLLTARPAERRPEDVKELMPVLTAIDLLLEAGYFKQADELYRTRLLDGEIFLTLPAVHEGRRCVLGFVGNKDRRQLCQQRISRRSMVRYLNTVALFSGNAGEPEEALIFYKKTLDKCFAAADWLNLAIAQRNLSTTLIQLGELDEAEEMARDAVASAKGMVNLVTATCLANLGYILGLKGRIDDALLMYNKAETTREAGNPEGERLFSTWEIKLMDLLLRIGQMDEASRLAEQTLRISKIRQWLNDVAGCHWILGRLDITRNIPRSANRQLVIAESILRRGHMLAELPWILLAQADLKRMEELWDEGARFADEALRISAPRNLGILHADSLLMRGRITMERTLNTTEIVRNCVSKSDCDILYAAYDDADAALQLSRRCSYVWGERDAFSLLATICGSLKERDAESDYRNSANKISKQLVG